MVKQKCFSVIILYVQYISCYKHVLNEQDNLRTL